MLRQLKKELLLGQFNNRMTTSLRTSHRAILKRHALKVFNDLGSWHAEMEISSRRLQLPTFVSPGPQQPRTPVHWFTVGAPVVSTMLGLVLLSLMDLLPGSGGFPTNRVANYALWGIEGAATVGECLANVGFPDVVYFASCLIDVMFFGLEVIWVFFDGAHISRPKGGTTCRRFSSWPGLLQGVCGNCIGVVRGLMFGNRCDRFCGSFGHEAEFAAVSFGGSCFPQAVYRISEQIPGDTILCQCRQTARQLSAAKFRQQVFASRIPRQLSTADVADPSSGTMVPAQQCVHDTPYILQIFTADRLGASSPSPLFSLWIQGQALGNLTLKPDYPGRRVTIQSAPLFLSQRPEMVQLFGQGQSYGYAEIRLIHGAENTTILFSENGMEPGNNSFWVRGPPLGAFFGLRFQNSFLIPAVGNFSNVSNPSTTITTTVGDGLESYRLEIVTSSREHAQLGPSESAVIAVSNPATRMNSTLISADTLTTAFECTAVTFVSNQLPANVTIAISPSRSNAAPPEWGWRAVYFVDNVRANTTALLNSADGEPRGQNEYWIGVTGLVPRNQTFAFPTITSTTITSTTTTAPNSCLSYTQWPDVLGLVCGNCEALVSATNYSSRCDLYCSSFLLECVSAHDDIDGTCARRNQVPCDVAVPNAGLSMLCTCTFGQASVPAAGCDDYVHWPQIDSLVCGGCSALVPLNDPPVNVVSCSQYCSSFGHTCSAAAMQGSTVCSVEEQVDCSATVQRAPRILCTCLHQSG